MGLIIYIVVILGMAATIWMISGAIGFVASYFFVRKIYTALNSSDLGLQKTGKSSN